MEHHELNTPVAVLDGQEKAAPRARPAGVG